MRMWTGQGRKKRQKKKEEGTLPGAKLIITQPDLSSRFMVFPACFLFFYQEKYVHVWLGTIAKKCKKIIFLFGQIFAECLTPVCVICPAHTAGGGR